jgi:hypothetical protein
MIFGAQNIFVLIIKAIYLHGKKCIKVFNLYRIFKSSKIFQRRVKSST